MSAKLQKPNSSPCTQAEVGRESLSPKRRCGPARNKAALPGSARIQREGKSRGFTIVEFLVLIGIALILVSIFLPYLLRIRETDRRVRCASNLRQIRDALTVYALANGHTYPRVVYDAVNNPNGYTSFTGVDDDNPFKANSHVKANDVTASLWLLVREKLVDPGVFICPSSGDSRDLLTDAAGRFVTAQQRGNFRHAINLSYSYSSPFSNAPSYHMDYDRKGDFALMADKSPGVGGESPRGGSGAMVSIISIDDSITGPAWNAPVLQRSRANSRNHGKAGQNVLYADSSVSFERTVYCGVGRSAGNDKPGDNIYTALSPTPLITEHRPTEQNGYWANDIGPAWEGDSYLVPTADEGPDSPPVLSQAPATKPVVAPPVTPPPVVIPATPPPATVPTSMPASVPSSKPATTRASS